MFANHYPDFPNPHINERARSLLLINMDKIEKNDDANLKTDALEVVKETKKELAAYRKDFEAQWKEFDDAYYGKQHKTGEGVKTVKNHIFKIIEQEIPVLTDSMPGTQVTASNEAMQPAADNLGKAIKYVYQDQNLPLLLPTLLRSGLRSAPGYLYIIYNPDADGGDGKIEYRQLPWKSVFLDGNAQTIEQSEKARIEIPMRRDAVARIWPEKHDEIMQIKGPDNLDSADESNYEKRDVAGRSTEVGKPRDFKAKDIVTYVETWVKSYELEDVEPEETQEQIDEETKQLENGEAPDIGKWENHDEHIKAHSQQRASLLSMVGLPPEASYEQIEQTVEAMIQQNPQAEELRKGLLTIKIIDNHIEEHNELKKLNPTGQEPKYEDGWRVIKSVENVILYDGENPEENGHIPLVPFYCYKDETIYGFGEIKNILDPQRTLNDMDFREFESLRLTSNPGWVVDHEAEVDHEHLTNAPGLVVEKKRGTEVRRLEAGQTSPQLEQRKALDQQAMESIAGQNEQTMNGAMPTGNASGAMVQKIQTQAVGRIRLKGRLFEYYSMRRLALITASLIRNHWTQEKTLRLRADDNTIEEVIYNPMETEHLDYTIDVSPGSMAGVDKDALISFYMALLNGQHIDFDMFLSATPEFPGKHTLVKKLKEKQEQQNQIAQVQQEAQAQVAQVQQQAQSIQAQAEQMKGENDLIKQVMSPDEKKVHQEMLRQRAIMSIQEQQVLENNGANDGQPENQG